MSYVSKMGIAGLMLASNAVFSAEPAEGWYAGFQLGGSFAQSTTTTNTITNSTFGAFTNKTYTQRLAHKIGGNIGGQLGYRCKKFRYEGELNLTYVPFDKKYFPSTNPSQVLYLKASSSLGAALFNVFYEFYDEDNPETKWVPYIGIGAGYSSIGNVYKLYYNQINTPVASGLENDKFNHNAPVAQGIAGIDYFFSDTMSLGLDFRYLSTNKIKSKFFDARLAIGSINLVMNFSFDQPDYAI